MKEDTYTILREKCKRVIDGNLDTDLLLNKSLFEDYYSALTSAKEMKFYRYFSPTEQNFERLTENRLPITPPKYFNDIFEGMVSSLDGLEQEQIAKIIDHTCKTALVTCLTERWDNLLMFAYYADSFKGFCVEYDFDLIQKSFPGFYQYFFPVLYQKNPCKLAKMKELDESLTKAETEKSISNDDLDDIISYFIHKANIWEHEKEWRLIIPFGSDLDSSTLEISTDSDRHYYGSNFDCVSAVYMGAGAKAEDKNNIIEIVKGKNKRIYGGSREPIAVYQTKIRPDSYELEKEIVDIS